MFTFLDLLIIVSMVLIAASLLSLVLMFLIRNKKVQRVCFYIAVALSIYVGYVGVRINRLGFGHQAAVALVLALISIGALVLERVKRNDERMFLIARIAAAAALILGVANALLI